MQANSGARLDTMSTQIQGISDNLQETLARMGKLNQQLTDAQNAIQGIDAKLASGAPPPVAGGPGATGTPGGIPAGPGGATSSALPSSPPPSADLLYSNGLRDLNGKKYDLASQEFQDYLKYYNGTDLASNAQFYLGQIFYMQQQYDQAVDALSKVIDNYPKSFKLAPAHLFKGLALVASGDKTQGVRELRTVVRMYPGTDEERRARAKLQELGIAS
jgi:tol-pal system protein YbgF